MKLMRNFFAALLLAALAVAALAADTKPKSAFDKATLESYVRYLLLWGPQINVSISDPIPSELPGMKQVTVHASAGGASRDEVFLISDDGQKVARANVFDINQDPFQNDLDKLTTVMVPRMGTPGAPVTLMLFSDFECGYCKQEADELSKNLLSTYPTQVQLYYKDFPLVQIHDWAKEAAIAGRCVYNMDEAKFWDYHDFIYAHQGELNKDNLKSKVMEFAKDKLDTLQLGRCIDQRATEKEIDQSIAEGAALQVNATPTIFVNGRRLPGEQAQWPVLKQIIAFELENAPKFGSNSSDDCCVVKLPTPTGQ